MKLFNIDGHTMAALCYNEDKPGIPLIFIHGLTDSIHFWEAMQPAYILEARRWYSVSLPGHFPAQFLPHVTFTEDYLAEMTFRTIQHLIGDEPFILAGVSTGGFMALNVATRYPEQVRGVISLSGFVGGWWHHFARFAQNVARLGEAGRWSVVGCLMLGGWSSRVFRMANLMTTASIHQAHMHRPALDSFIDTQIYPDYASNRMQNLYLYIRHMHRFNLVPLLPQITCPTLVMWCERDPFVPQRQALAIAESVPGSELVELKNTGHFPMWENPAYDSIVTDWITGIK